MDPLRIALLASRHAPGVDRLLRDPQRGSTWDLVLAVGSETELTERAILERAGVPVELRPMRHSTSFRNLLVREQYDDGLGDLLARMRADYVFLVGYDYVCLDGQHGLFGYQGLLNGLIAVQAAGGSAGVARVDSNNPTSICRALDAGADAIIVPLGIALAVRLIPGPLMAEHRAAAALAQSRPVSRAGAVAIIAVWIAAVLATGWLVWRHFSV